MLKIANIKEAAKICLFNASYLLGHPLRGPDTLQISLTNRCNLSCKMCSARKYATPKSQEMPLDEIKKIIASACRQFDIKKLILTGGEPLLLGNDIVDTVRFAKEKGLAVIITTSAFFLSEYARSLAESGISHFHVSLDGLSQVHNELRGSPLSFDKAVEGIRILSDIRSKSNLEYTIGIASLILKNNVKDLFDLYKFADELKVDIFDMFPYLADNTDFASPDCSALWPDEYDLDEFMDIYGEISRFKTRHIKLNPYFNAELIVKYYTKKIRRDDWRCFAGFKNIFITMSDPKRTGRFEPCLFFCKDHIPIREYNYNLKKIWNCRRTALARHAIKRCDAYCYQMCFSLPSALKVIAGNN